MQILWVFLILAVPGISTLIICQRLGIYGNQALNVLVGLIVYVLLQLLPVHLLATLELLQLVDTVSLFYIAMIEVFILLSLLLWSRFDLGVAIRRCREISFVSYFRTLPGYVILSLGIVAACYLVFTINLLTSYPGGWDGLHYHLPLAVRWLQEGSLGLPLSKYFFYSLPGNAEIPMMILLGIGWQALATLFNLIAVVILVYACYLIVLKCGASRVAAFICALILSSIPIVNFQAFSGYIDLYGSSFFMAAVALFVYRHETPNQITKQNQFLIRIILSGLACGIAIGTKHTFYVYAAVFFLVVLITLFVERKRQEKSLVLLTALLLIAMLAPSIFWFGRAFFATGNPFYPLGLEIHGNSSFKDNIAPDPLPKIGKKSVNSFLIVLKYPWTEAHQSNYSYGTGSGLGASFATFIPLGIFYAMSTNFLNRNKNKNGIKNILTLLFFVGLVLWWFILRQMPRFGIPLLALACIISSSLVDYFLQSKSRLFGVLLVCSLATTCLISALIPVRSLASRMHFSNWTRSEIYNIPSQLDELPQGTVILNLNKKEYFNNFALAGKYLSNRVIPRFDAPHLISEEFLRNRKVDYIAEMSPYYIHDLAALQGIEVKLIYDETKILKDPIERSWRVWKVIRE